MAILDKILGVGEAVRDKVKETFGEPSLSSDDDGAVDDSDTPEGTALDAAGAYAALGLADPSGEGATLADVREAYRAMARHYHPVAVRDGVDSASQAMLDRLLEALELLEELLVPLSPVAGAPGAPGATGSVTPGASRPPPTRKRATARKR